MEEWKPESSASFWVNRASRTLLDRQNRELRLLGMAMSHMPILHALQSGTPMTQKALAERAHVEQPTMAVTLTRLERDGIIQRTPDPTDRRSALTVLTKEARRRWPKARAALVNVERDAAEGLTAAEKKQLVGLLQRLVSNLERTSGSLSE